MSAEQSPKLMVVAGEASGDLHGAHLVTALKKLIPNVNCYGLGGEMMHKAGVDIRVNVSELSVVGLIEVLKHYPRLRIVLNKMKRELQNDSPDLLVLIDSPDFNLPLAKTAKKYGVKVMYYISPQIWAWRSSRIKTIQKCVDLMAVVFPFEVPFYKDSGVTVEFVGHPLVKDAVSTISKENFYTVEKLDSTKKLVGLFPGSRVSEIENNYPVLLQAAVNLIKQNNNIQFITPIASTLSNENLKKFTGKYDINIKITTSNIYDVINACDAIAAVSGTVTLQITLMQTPMLIIYKISPLTYLILKKIVKFTYAGIANVIANKEICREFIQNDATPNNISSELERLLSDEKYVSQMKHDMGEVKEKLGNRGGAASAAMLAADLINS